MASLPYIQIYIADYLADTAHLTAAQHGAYLLLIFNYWQKGHSLNNSNERLTNVARMNQQEWNESRGVLQEFFTIEGDEWVHERIEEDLERVRVKTTQKSNAGRASAQQRGNKRSTSVQQTFNERATNEDKEEEEDKEIKDSPRKKSRGTKISTTFSITKEMREWSVKEKVAVDIDAETVKFIDYAIANGRVLKDWTAAWRNWIRNAVEFAKGKQPKQSPSYPCAANGYGTGKVCI